MEFLNRIKIRGIVGKADISSYGDSRVCHFSVVTEYGIPEGVDVTWFNVSAWERGNRKHPAIDKLEKGMCAEVEGRVRLRNYTTADGVERSSIDVIARKVAIIDRDADDDGIQPQRDL